LPAQASFPPERAIAEQAPERHEPGPCAHVDRYEQPRADATPAEGDGQGEAPVPRDRAGRDSQQQAPRVEGAVSDGTAAGKDSVRSAIVSGLSAVARERRPGSEALLPGAAASGHPRGIALRDLAGSDDPPRPQSFRSVIGRRASLADEATRPYRRLPATPQPTEAPGSTRGRVASRNEPLIPCRSPLRPAQIHQPNAPIIPAPMIHGQRAGSSAVSANAPTRRIRRRVPTPMVSP
jgi:hypothetical protein